tara:strand:- start:1265 stop:2035 length:771 start_codon:yes stop_codon:yes gene_type:complete
MQSKTISRNTEYLYDNVDEFRTVYPNEKLMSDWRKSKEGQWVLTDDLQVCKILKRSNMKTGAGKDMPYVRTILGTYTTNPNVDMGGNPPKNVYSFSNNKFCKKLRQERKKPTNNEFLFAKYVAKGMNPTEAYMRVFPTKKELYAKESSRSLLKTKRVQKLVTDEIEAILSDIGASKSYLLEQTKNVIDNIDGKDGDKLRAIELLMKIANMFPNEKKTESLTVFQGFSEEQLKRINSSNTKVLAHAEKRIDDSTHST